MTTNQMSLLNITDNFNYKEDAAKPIHSEQGYITGNLNDFRCISMKTRVQIKELTENFMYRDSRREIQQSFFPSIRSTFNNQVILPDIFDYPNLIIKVYSLKPTQEVIQAITEHERNKGNLKSSKRVEEKRKKNRKRKETNVCDKEQKPNACGRTLKGTSTPKKTLYLNFNQIYGKLLIYQTSLSGI